MDRRTLIAMGLGGAGVALFAPRLVAAAGTPMDAIKSPLAGSVFYTMDSPGRWAKKAVAHTPQIERSGDTIEVSTGHPMDDHVHYIVKHVVLDENFAFVSETLFDPEKDSPISEYDVAGLGNVVYALSLCNKHDLWLNALAL